MPFDAIMGVGRTPKVTEDLLVQSGSILKTNIAGSLNITTTLGTNATLTGVEENLINSDFDSTNYNAFSIQHNTTTGVNTTSSTVILDLKKVVYFDSLKLQTAQPTFNNASGAASSTLSLSISSDGISFSDAVTRSVTSNMVLDYTINLRKLRFIRILFNSTLISGTSNFTTVNLRNLNLFLSTIQY